MADSDDPTAAAERATRRRLDRYAAETVASGYAATLASERDWHPWVRALADDITARLLSRRSRACLHLWAGPQPVQTAAWARDLVVCDRCAAAGALELTGSADTTCDRCGGQCPDQMHPGILTLGLVTVTYGLCPGCYADVDQVTWAALARRRRRRRQ
jgi:hypothetical protein